MNDYLKYDVTKETDAVEKHFCEKFDKVKFEPLSKEEMRMLVEIVLSKWTEEQQNDIEKTLLKKSVVYLILHLRIQGIFNITLDVKTKVFLSCVIDSPGTAVMYGTYIVYKMKLLKIKHLTISGLCENIFPWGFPDENTLHNLWKSQKVWRANSEEKGSDNLLDYDKAIESLIQK